jgi:hypothetical protein
VSFCSQRKTITPRQQTISARYAQDHLNDLTLPDIKIRLSHARQLSFFIFAKNEKSRGENKRDRPADRLNAIGF